MTLFDLFYLTCGLSLFLFGMQRSEKSLKLAAGVSLRTFLERLTSNPLVALLVGIGLTLVTQSSSATTVMLVGFASAGLVTLTQTLGVILGADIATTVTVQLFAWKVTRFAPLLVSLGYLAQCTGRTRRWRSGGELVMGFGLVLLGMTLMSEAVRPLYDSPVVVQWFGTGSSPLVVLVLAALFTAIIQSSAAVIAMVMVLLCAPGANIPLVNGIAVVLGANVGTCATALLSALGAGTEGKRVALAHILFKLAGVVLFAPLLHQIASAAAWVFPLAPARQIANVHTAYNVVMAVVFVPLLPLFDRLVRHMVPSPPSRDNGYRVAYIRDDYVHTPSLALAQGAKEIARMGEIVCWMFDAACSLVARGSVPKVEEIKARDDEVDFLNQAIGVYLAGLSQQEVNEQQAHRQAALLTVSAQIEQIGDVVATDLCHNLYKLMEKGVCFSVEGVADIDRFHAVVRVNLRDAIEVFVRNDASTARTVLMRKGEIDRLEELLCKRHFARLRSGLREAIETTAIHVDVLADLRAVNSHACRIAAMVAAGEEVGDATGWEHDA